MRYLLLMKAYNEENNLHPVSSLQLLTYSISALPVGSTVTLEAMTQCHSLVSPCMFCCYPFQGYFSQESNILISINFCVYLLSGYIAEESPWVTTTLQFWLLQILLNFLLKLKRSKYNIKVEREVLSWKTNIQVWTRESECEQSRVRYMHEYIRMKLILHLH